MHRIKASSLVLALVGVTTTATVRGPRGQSKTGSVSYPTQPK